MSNTKYIILLAAIFIPAFIVYAVLGHGSSLGAKVSSENEVSKLVPVVVTHAEYPEWVESAHDVAKRMPNVFIARIKDKIGDRPIKGEPTTAYQVEILHTLSGDASGEVTLLQGGVGYLSGKLVASDHDVASLDTDLGINPDDVFFKVGTTYLFTTVHWENYYVTSIPPYDRELITTDTTLTDAQILELADKNGKVREFKQAVGTLNNPQPKNTYTPEEMEALKYIELYGESALSDTMQEEMQQEFYGN